MDMTSLQLRHGAEPFLLDGGAVGCVCTHGFTAAPDEMLWLGEYLHARGLTVYAPRLAGHGTDPDMMRRQHWADWYEGVLDGIALLRARCRKVFAVGLSMGGLLSLLADSKGQVDGAVILAAPLRVDEPLLPFAPIVKHFRRYTRKTDWPGKLDEQIREAQRMMGREVYGRLAYDVIPTASAWQLYRLMRVVRRRLDAITVPLLLIYSLKDGTVPYDNLATITDNVRSRDLVVHTLEQSDHVISQDVEREIVFEQVWQFLAARLD